MWRELRRRLARPRWDGPLPALVPVLVSLALALLFIRVADRELRPHLEAEASSQAVNLMTQAINAAVDDCLTANGMSYSDFVTVETDSVGRVTTLTGKTAESSRFRRQVVEAVLRRLESIDQRELGVPLGTLTGLPLLTGQGPDVRVRVRSVGSVTAEYASSFTAAGVNQTHHQVHLNVTAQVDLFLPGEILPVTVSNAVCVAETVIVGEAPDTYLNLEQRSG